MRIVQALRVYTPVVVKSDGSIYFTDPNGGFVPEQWDLAFAGVYRVSADRHHDPLGR
jgi:sugar lactone lactonase YvrE